MYVDLGRLSGGRGARGRGRVRRGGAQMRGLGYHTGWTGSGAQPYSQATPSAPGLHDVLCPYMAQIELGFLAAVLLWGNTEKNKTLIPNTKDPKINNSLSLKLLLRI